MPRPTPDTADRIDIAMIANSAASRPTTLGAGASASPFMSHSRPVTAYTPSTNWLTPKPMVTDTPRIVATTPSTSTKCPSGPLAALPSRGVSAERIVSGMPRV